MKKRRHWERSADNANRLMRGAQAVRLSRAARRCHCPTDRAFIRVAKARTCSRDTALFGDEDLTHRRRDYLNRSYPRSDLQVYV